MSPHIPALQVSLISGPSCFLFGCVSSGQLLPLSGLSFLICERQTVAAGFSQQKMASLLVLFFWLSLCSPSPAETLAPGQPEGPLTTLGTPLGQWVLGWRQAASRNQLQLSTHSPPPPTSLSSSVY